MTRSYSCEGTHFVRMASAVAKAAKSREDPAGMDDEAQLLKDLARIPALSAAWVGQKTSNGYTATVQYTQRDLGGNKMRKFLRTFSLPSNFQQGNMPVVASFAVELRDVLLHSVAPSGSKQLIARTSKEGDATILELWNGGAIEREVQVPKDLHGKIYNDNWFGMGAAWSRDESHIAYVAEEAPAVKTPDWGAGQRASKDTDTEEAEQPPQAGPKSWRGVGEFQEDWGELNTGKKVPKLFVLEFASGKVTAVPGLPDDCSVGQPVWTPDGSGIIFVAWPHKAFNFPRLPQRLGIVYCLNRPCFLYLSPAPDNIAGKKPEEAQVVDTGLKSCFCPQFSPNGETLAFMSNHAAVTSGAHCASATLESLPWPSQGPRRTLVGLVDSPADESCFPGLYTFLLGRLPFAFVDDQRLLATTHWRSFLRVVEVNLSPSGEVASMTPQSPLEPPAPCWMLLAAQNGIALASCSGPSRPPQLMAASLGQGDLTWQHVALEEGQQSPELAGFLDPGREAYKVLQVKPRVGPCDLPCEAVLLLTDKGPKRAPTVLTPHGGPHSVFAAAHILSNAFLNLLGFNVLQVNYRGSLGFGEGSVQSLLGNIGTHDVSDCMASLDAAIDEGWVDPEKVAVIGGSHGGFLAGHLLGQHPERFKAGVLRNPVLDLALMCQISDIPDWAFVEAFGSPEGLTRASVKPSFEELRRLSEVSPVSHISAVKSPMLFLLGAKDRRVIMKDAHQYVAALAAKDNSPETRVIVFPEDTHSLDQPQTEFEQWLNAAWWLKRFL